MDTKKEVIRYILTLLFLLTGMQNEIVSQEIPTKKAILDHYKFSESTLKTNNDTIHYYTYQKDQKELVQNMVVYIQGSHPSPLFSYEFSGQDIRMNCWLIGDYLALPSNYLYVVIEKSGFEGVFDEKNISIPKIYHEKNSLGHRAKRIHRVIQKLNEQHELEKIIVYGHSEGAPVAAKLGTISEEITHLGFWSGNALPDFFDAVLDIKETYYKKEMTDEEASNEIMGALNHFTQVIAKDSLSTEVDDFGYTNKRWWSYAEPPINNLLKIEIPLFVQAASLDQSAPVESSYLIPLEFARLGKKNLSFNVCIGCDHGYVKTDSSGKKQNEWRNIFINFLNWVQQH